MRLKADAGEEVAAERGGKVADLIETWREVVQLTRTARHRGRLFAGNRQPHRPPVRRDGAACGHEEHGREMARRIMQVTPIQANRSLGVLSSFMTWLEHDGKVSKNPCRGVERGIENERHIFLDAEEIVAAHAALNGDNHNQSAALALRLSLLTGCRIGEAIGLDAAQLDLTHKNWIKPASTTKQKKSHIVPLQQEALAIARQLMSIGLPDYESCKRCWERARKIIGREDVKIHDLRHSRASALARGGASLPQIGRVLGHSAPATTQRYAHLVATDLRDLVERA